MYVYSIRIYAIKLKYQHHIFFYMYIYNIDRPENYKRNRSNNFEKIKKNTYQTHSEKHSCPENILIIFFKFLFFIWSTYSAESLQYIVVYIILYGIRHDTDRLRDIIKLVTRVLCKSFSCICDINEMHCWRFFFIVHAYTQYTYVYIDIFSGNSSVPCIT